MKAIVIHQPSGFSAGCTMHIPTAVLGQLSLLPFVGW